MPRKLFIYNELEFRARLYGDWLVRSGENGGIKAIRKVDDETAEAIWKRLATPEYTLDVDATVIEAE